MRETSDPIDRTSDPNEAMTLDSNLDTQQPTNPRKRSWKNWCHKALLIADSALLLAVFVAQAAILDYFLISHNNGNSEWYFWLFGDFVLFIFLIVGSVSAYRHHSYRCSHQVDGDGLRRSSTANSSSAEDVMDEIDFPQPRPSSQTRPYGGIFALHFPKWMGTLPLIYLIWFAYSILLVAKIVILFKLTIAQRYSDETAMGIPLFKVSIAASAIVFLLWVEANRDKCEKNEEMKSSVGGSVASELQSSTVFELFDSIEFLHLVLPKESHLLYPFWMEDLVLGLASINFIIPTLSLLRLSLANMGKYRGTSFAILLSLAILISRFLFVNIPYLWLRVHFSIYSEQGVSIFILKNFLGIISTLRHIIPEVRLYFKLRQQEKRRRTSKINPEQGGSDDNISGAGKKKKRVTISSIPLSIVFNSATNKASDLDPCDPSDDKVALRRTSSSSEPEQNSSQLEQVSLNVQPSSPSSHSTTTTSNDENESTKI